MNSIPTEYLKNRNVSRVKREGSFEKIGYIFSKQAEEARDLMRCVIIAQKWPTCAGREVNRKTAISGFATGKLFIKTFNATWAANLTAMKKFLLDKLNKEIKPFEVKDLIFTPAYPLRKPQEPKIPPKEYSLTKEELLIIEEKSSYVKDYDIRQAYQKFIKRDTLWKKEKIDKGGSVCPLCGCVHEERGVCVVCKAHIATLKKYV